VELTEQLGYLPGVTQAEQLRVCLRWTDIQTNSCRLCEVRHQAEERAVGFPC
jgi:hypothetical protein